MKNLISKLNKTHYDNDVIYYEFQVVLFNLLPIFIMLIIALLTHTQTFSFYFLVCFCKLRITHGGWHSQTPIGCLVMTTIIFITITMIYKYTTISFWIFSIMILVYLLIKKHLDDLILLVLIMFCAVCFNTNIPMTAFVLAFIVFQIFYYIKFKTSF